jgi:hypothetical protein
MILVSPATAGETDCCPPRHVWIKEEKPMSKYYVTCGSLSLVVTAESAHQAAIRLLDEAMASHVWIYDDADLSDSDRRDHLTLEALLHLASSVSVSERGLGRQETAQFGVPELLEHWHCLMTAVSRLFVAAGLPPRRVLPAPLTATVSPRLPR